ncbi:hypothetical protein PYCC9005_004942 [Savitreella phatthalungensis]
MRINRVGWLASSLGYPALHPQIAIDLEPYVTRRYSLGSVVALSQMTPDWLLESLRMTRGWTLSSNGAARPTVENEYTVSAPWYLQRMGDSRLLEFDEERSKALGYHAPATSLARGDNVHGYILDSGVDCDHRLLAGRAICFTSADRLSLTSSFDKFGHGTQVAGAMMAKHYGASAAMHVYSVKVVHDDGQAWLNTVLEGIEWVVDSAPSRGDRRRLIVLPLTMEDAPAMEPIIDAAEKEGFVIIATGGSAGQNSCQQSPAKYDKVITVSGFDMQNQFHSTASPWGDCVDLLAPATDIITPSPGGEDRDWLQLSRGTSVATGLVAGTVGNWLSSPIIYEWPPVMVKRWVVKSAQPDTVLDALTGGPVLFGNTPNRVVQLPRKWHIECIRRLASLNPSSILRQCAELTAASTIPGIDRSRAARAKTTYLPGRRRWKPEASPHPQA